jgi:hypothetical protein
MTGSHGDTREDWVRRTKEALNDRLAWRQEAKRLERQVKAARKLARQVGRLLAGVDRDEAARRATQSPASCASSFAPTHARLRDTLDALAAFRKAAGDA